MPRSICRAAVVTMALSLVTCGQPPGTPDGGTPDGGTGPARFTLTLTTSGTGTGAIQSSPDGISCGLLCTATFPEGTALSLIATPTTGTQFTGWGGPCTGTGSCVFTLTADTTLTAGFDLVQFPVTVARTGNGMGTVTSAPAGIDCGATCTSSIAYGTALTLTAAPVAGSTFLGWTGGGCSGTGPCMLTVLASADVTATFALDQTLVVTRAGFGTGTVTSMPAGIACGTDCDEIFPTNTAVTLTAAAATDSVFTGWSGGGCTGNGPCTVTVGSAVMVTATFEPRRHTLTVARAGNGTGLVTSAPAGIDCGTDCSEDFAIGAMVTLTATATGPSTFTGWSGGGCTGTAACVVTVGAATNVTATFTASSLLVTVVLAGTGTGAVTSSPGGITCGNDCTDNFLGGSTVALTAAPATGFRFAGWSGGGCTGTGQCLVLVTADTTVTATFSPDTVPLTVVKAGNGTGVVTSAPAGIACGTDCSEGYDANTVVTLVAAPSSSSRFSGWSGGGCSGTGPCMTTVAAATTVTATFVLESYVLTVVTAGAGTGTVTSNPPGISCGSDCSETYLATTPVVLTAVAGSGSAFAGWSGAGCSGTGTCTVTIAAADTVTATFSRPRHVLTIAPAGNGTGVVTSGPAGITCGSDCSEPFDEGTVVTLIAAPSSSSTFTGWSGGGCSGTAPCMATASAAATITATFTLNSYALTVMKAGAGAGTVTSNPPGIDCGADCSETYLATTPVVLTATPGSGMAFTGWSGACTGTGACTVPMDAAATVTATFAVPRHLLTVTRAGTGTGSVASAPAGITCGADCTELYDANTVVTLTPTPATNASFAGWSGGGCTGTGQCVTTMTAATTVTATFNLNSYAITVVKAGSGVGTVTSTPSGIDCGADCTETFLATTMVVLTAAAGTDSTFIGWAGASGCTTAASCTVTVSAAVNVTATFNLTPYVLTVAKAGNGTGTVVSAPAGIVCATSCASANASYPVNTTVTLTATPAANASFAGWSGGGCSGTGPCMTTITAAATVTATFTLNSYLLTVAKAGTGIGTVTSNPPGIGCGADCSETYLATTPVVLTAAAGTDSTFVTWAGAPGCSTAAMCTVNIAAASTVTATFNTTQLGLTVTKAGNATGTVTSAPAGINCGTTCSNTTAQFAVNTMVTLTAAPAANATFAGWSGGGCSGTAPCMTTLTAATTVTATFTLQSFPLNVTLAGTGTGTVTSNPAGIDCGADCSEPYLATSTVALTAVPGPNSVFAGWSGGGCTGTGACNAVIGSGPANVTATFNLTTHLLTLTKAGNGAGTVTSAPAGISCGTTCSGASASFAYNTTVTLTAAPSTTSTFAGWSGGGCSGTGTCITTVTAAATVVPTFTLNSYALTVAKNGTGTGTVSSSPAGIDCGADCSETVLAGTVIALTAVPGPNSVFSGWSGACTGTGACNVTVNGIANVFATFNLALHRLTVTKNGTGAGTVSSSPLGLNCGTDCLEDYNSGTMVTLSAAPAVGSTFTGWSGAGCSGTGTCVVTMTAATTVTATFTANTFALDVTLAGAGTGSVTSSPPGISCGADCSETYVFNTTVTLTAAPSGSSTFAGWSGGGCSGTATMCVVSMTVARTVTATFN